MIHHSIKKMLPSHDDYTDILRKGTMCRRLVLEVAIEEGGNIKAGLVKCITTGRSCGNNKVNGMT